MKETLFQRITRIKKPDDLIQGTKKNELKKALSAFDLIVLGIGAVIGAGIFTLSGIAIAGDAQAGPSFILSLVIAATACVLAGFSYAEFAAMLPVSGSAYTYTYATMGELAAWLIGWVLMLEYAIGNITVANGWTGYLFQLLAGFKGILPDWVINESNWVHTYRIFDSIPININIPSLFIIAVVTVLLYKGIQESTRTATLMVLTKLVVIILFIIIGAHYVKPENWTPFMPGGVKGMFQGAFLIFFAYVGFDAVSTAAEETKNPQKDVPIGIIGSLSICTLIYIGVAAVLTGMIPWQTIDTHAPIAAAMRAVNQGWFAGLISIGAVAGLTSVLLVLQLGTTRILFAMARDRFLPGVFSTVHSTFKTPHVITIITGLFTAIGTIVLPMEAAAHLCNIGTFAAFIMVSIGVMIMRVREPHRHRPFKLPLSDISIPITRSFSLPLYPVIPILSIVFCLVIIKNGIPLYTLLLFSGWIALGTVIYFSYGYKNVNKFVKEDKFIGKETDELNVEEDTGAILV